MQCWVFRLAQSKWKKTPQEIAVLFKQFDIFGFIADCYDTLHLNSYQCVLRDIEEMLERKGVIVC